MRLIIPETEVLGAESRMDDTLPGGTDAEEYELSAVFHILRAKRRRLAIAIIDQDGKQDLRELAKKSHRLNSILQFGRFRMTSIEMCTIA